MDLVEIAKAANPRVMNALHDMAMAGDGAVSSGSRNVSQTPVHATEGLQQKLREAARRQRKSRSARGAARLYAIQGGTTPQRATTRETLEQWPFSRTYDREVFVRNR